MSRLKNERHNIGRIGWLRAAVLGANDGIVSPSSPLMGVAAAAAGRPEILFVASAGLAAGVPSIAAANMSRSVHRPTGRRATSRDRGWNSTQAELELHELTQIYVDRGLDAALARQVAEQLTAGDALAAHAPDELANSSITSARPLQAAIASGATFSVGAVLPRLVVFVSPPVRIRRTVRTTSLAFFALLFPQGARGRRPDRQSDRVRGVLERLGHGCDSRRGDCLRR
jgi:VIT1/CCC1 family predicted Fe2+/Mn2+ transporter